MALHVVKVNRLTTLTTDHWPLAGLCGRRRQWRVRGRTDGGSLADWKLVSTKRASRCCSVVWGWQLAHNRIIGRCGRSITWSLFTFSLTPSTVQCRCMIDTLYGQRFWWRAIIQVDLLPYSLASDHVVLVMGPMKRSYRFTWLRGCVVNSRPAA